MVELFSIPPFAGLITSNKFTISEECFTPEEQVNSSLAKWVNPPLTLLGFL